MTTQLMRQLIWQFNCKTAADLAAAYKIYKEAING